MSTGEVRRVSRQEIQLVQNLIERCLQLYMNQKEVVNTLLIQAKIEPSFTELVWQKLEEENREFFKAYHVRLMVKNQIEIFNELLEKQAQLMREIQPTGVAPSSLLNGSNPSSLQQKPLHYASAPRQDHSHCSVLPSTVINGARPAHQGIQLTNGGTSISTGRTDITPAVLPANQNMHMGMLQGMNGTAVKLEPDYSSNTDFAFCANSFLDQRPATEEAAGSGTSFGCSGLGGQPINDPLLETDPPLFGFLSQIPRNFSFSDLTDHFNQSPDILESYGKSPFLGPGSNDFCVSPRREYQGEDKKLDTITERYDGFGSD